MTKRERVGIHAETGTDCYASARACKYGESHVKNEEEFIAHQVNDNGLNEPELRKVISDGATLGEAVEIVRSGASQGAKSTLRKNTKSEGSHRSKRELQALSKTNPSDPKDLLEIARHGSEKAREYLATNPHVTSEALNEAYALSDSDAVRKSLVRNVRMDLSKASVSDAVHGILAEPHPAYGEGSTRPIHKQFAIRESEERLRGSWVTREHVSTLTQEMASRPGFDSTRLYDRHPAGILAHVALGESHEALRHDEKYDLARYAPAVAERMIGAGEISKAEYENLPLGSRAIGGNSDPDFIRFATETFAKSAHEKGVHNNADRERVAHSILLNENTPSVALENPVWRTENGAYDVDLAIHKNTPEHIKAELLRKPAVRGYVNLEEAKKRSGHSKLNLANDLITSREIIEDDKFRSVHSETITLDPQKVKDYGLTSDGINSLFDGRGAYDEATHSYHTGYDSGD